MDASALTYKFAALNATADGNNTIVAAVAGRKIRVLAYALTNATTAGVSRFDDGAANVLARFNFALNGGASFAGDVESPAFETAVGQSLVINNAAGADILGHLTYIEV